MSKTTTYLLGPPDDEGFIDYATAINERARRGVTRENNAAIPILEAVGPKRIDEHRREDFFELLGAPELSEDGDYFVDSFHFMKRINGERPVEADTDVHLLFSQTMETALSRPWSEAEFPDAAAWLKRNEQPLNRIVEASKRTRYFTPVASGPGEWLWPNTEVAAELRDVVRALRMRAMLAAQKQEIDKAWDDLAAVHRLARLVGQGPSQLHGILASSFEDDACTGDAIVATRVQLAAGQLRRLREQFNRLPPLPPVDWQIEYFGRFIFLNNSLHMAIRGAGGIATDSDDRPMSETQWQGVTRDVDWNEILRQGNELIYRAAKLLGGSPSRQQRDAAKAWQIDFEERTAAFTVSIDKSRELYRRLTQGAPAEKTEILRCILLQLAMPQVTLLADSRLRIAIRRQVTDLAFALATFRAEHGAYPDQLAELSPTFVDEVPRDLFSGGDLHYLHRADGYLL